MCTFNGAVAELSTLYVVIRLFSFKLQQSCPLGCSILMKYTEPEDERVLVQIPSLPLNNFVFLASVYIFLWASVSLPIKRRE